MGRHKDNLLNKRFGRLVVVAEGPGYIEKCSGFHKPDWYCNCDCGKKNILIRANNLKNGQSSCGCLAIENIKKANSRKNRFDLSMEYGKGYDINNNMFLFDLDDFDKIKNMYWAMFNNGYFVATYKSGDKRKTVQLHRFIMDAQNEDYHKIVVDHINGIKSDNRKSNLRIVSRRYNNTNIARRKDNKSGQTGVYWNKSKQKWIANINDKRFHHKELGAFSKLEDAIKARKEAEKKYYSDNIRRT